MVRNKSEKNEPQGENPTAAPGQNADRATGAEFPGIHVLGKQDTTKHFGSGKAAKFGKDRQPGTNYPTVDVQLQLDKEIWENAKTEAERAGLEVSKYVEVALKGFTPDSRS